MLRARLLPLLAIAFSAAGCGLPAPFYLAPPGIPLLGLATFSTPRFYVESTTANNEPDFRGFELYYKFYNSEDSIEEGFGSDSQLIQMTGFLPMCMSTDTSPQGRSAPLILVDPLDRGQVFTVTLDFTVPGDAACESTVPLVSVSVRRAVSTGGTECKTFAYDQFQSGDPDIISIPGGIDLLGGATIYMGIYALSYGRQDLATPIWSSPVYLGWTEIIKP